MIVYENILVVVTIYLGTSIMDVYIQYGESQQCINYRAVCYDEFSALNKFLPNWILAL